jgi:Domain of unknown function (DUF4159)
VRRRAAVALALAAALSAMVAAQRARFWDQYAVEPRLHNVPYDGRFTFARIKYTTAPGGFWYQGMPSWSHGYPVSEGNLLRILNEVTLLRGRTDGFNVLALDDPQLFKYPIAYIIEVGWWTLNEREAAALRTYIDKGGFVIVDDFKTPSFNGGGGWDLFESNMRRVFPGGRFYDMQATHPIFHSFFEINSLGDFPQAYNAGQPVFRGLYQDNDPRKRLQMIVNYNTDISQYWEWSGRGLRPFDETNEAYKLGVNYVMYGMTH